MQTMNQALAGLVQRRIITPEEAYAHTGDADELKTMIEGRGQRPNLR